MNARTSKRNAVAVTGQRDREKRLLASLIDPAPRDTAAAIVEKIGLRVEMFADDTLRENYHALKAHGPATFAVDGTAYLEKEPVAEYSTASAATLEADCREIVAAYRKRNPPPTCKDAADWLKEPDQPDDPLIENLIERGSLIAIVGPAKAAKSFIALETAACLATGNELLARKTKRQRVYYANIEVSAKQCKKRLRAICDALNIAPESLRNWLFIDNLRGETATWTRCFDEAKQHNAQVVIVDPFYQVFKGKETDEGDCLQAVEEMKRFLAAGFTLFVVFHAPKGYSGDRQVVDMISGSSVLARFPESVIAILPHATEKLARVIDCSVLRDYSPPDPFSVKFEKGALVMAPEIEPALPTGRGTRRTGRTTAVRNAETVKEQNELEERLDAALKRYLDKRGDDLPSAADIKKELRRTFPKGKVEDFLKIKRGCGELAQTPQKMWDADAKTWRNVGSGQNGVKFTSTPERIAAYVKKTSELPLT